MTNFYRVLNYEILLELQISRNDVACMLHALQNILICSGLFIIMHLNFQISIKKLVDISKHKFLSFYADFSRFYLIGDITFGLTLLLCISLTTYSKT